jgi:hypothetical protein
MKRTLLILALVALAGLACGQSIVIGPAPQPGAVAVAKGPGFVAGRAAVINSGGKLDGAAGTLSNCVKVDGSSGPCGNGSGGGGDTTYVAVASNSPTAYVGTSAGCPGSLATGQVYLFKPDITNNGTAPTFNPCGFGAATIVEVNGDPLAASELDVTGSICQVTYTGSAYLLAPLLCSTGPAYIAMQHIAFSTVPNPPSGQLAFGFDTSNGDHLSVRNHAGAIADLQPPLRQTKCYVAGKNNGDSVLVDADLGPQAAWFRVDGAWTLLEVAVSADAGTPSSIPGRLHAGSVASVLSSALATAANGGVACANAGGGTGLDGSTTCSAKLQNTAFATGDWITLVSGTAGGVAVEMSICLTFAVNP